MPQKIVSIYNKLYKHFGPQHWWPADSPFEVMVGAILTQNTSWANVEKAINNLKNKKLLEPVKLNNLDIKKLAILLKPAGYYNIKAKRLKNFLKYFIDKYAGKIEKMKKVELKDLRAQLLEVNGIGQETADSILLYALNKPIFVIDAYTKRILSRHKIISEKLIYEEVQKILMANCPARVYNEYHALLVKLAKEYCLKNKPRCELCPLNNRGS